MSSPPRAGGISGFVRKYRGRNYAIIMHINYTCECEWIASGGSEECEARNEMRDLDLLSWDPGGWKKKKKGGKLIVSGRG